MPRVVKQIDPSQGHCWPPTMPIPNTSTQVYSENIKIVVVGDQYLPHPGGCGSSPTHPVATIVGSPSVFVSNLPIVRDMDPLSCGDIARSQFGSVYCN